MQGVPDQPRLVAGEILPAQTVARTSPPTTEPSAAALRSPGFSGFGADDRRQAKAGPLLFWSTVVLAVFLVFWIAGGHRLVLDPLAETIRNSPAQALQIEDVASRIERHEGRSFLVVDGAARNNGGEPLSLPSIVISVAETDGPTLRYYLETNQVVLGPGQAHDFSSRLDAPSKGVASVSITFQEGSR